MPRKIPFFARNFANRCNSSVEKWVFISKIDGQLTKQHRFGKKIIIIIIINTSLLTEFDGFRIRVVLERVVQDKMTTSMAPRTSPENLTLLFCNLVSVIPRRSDLPCKMCTNYPGIKLL